MQFNAEYPSAPNVFVVCGNPIGTLLVRAMAKDSLNAQSQVAASLIEVLPPDRVKLLNKVVTVSVDPSSPFTVPAKFEIEVRRGDEKIGTCASLCAKSIDWYPPNPPGQPGQGWNVSRNEPSFEEIESCNCIPGSPSVNCISPPTHQLRIMMGPYTPEQWESHPEGAVFARMAVKVRYDLPKCHGATLSLYSGTIKFTFKKIRGNRVRVEANQM